MMRMSASIPVRAISILLGTLLLIGCAGPSNRFLGADVPAGQHKIGGRYSVEIPVHMRKIVALFDGRWFPNRTVWTIDGPLESFLQLWAGKEEGDALFTDAGVPWPRYHPGMNDDQLLSFIASAYETATGRDVETSPPERVGNDDNDTFRFEMHHFTGCCDGRAIDLVRREDHVADDIILQARRTQFDRHRDVFEHIVASFSDL